MTRALNSTSIQTLETNNNEILGNSGDRDEWKVKMLYDGDCPLCLREVFVRCVKRFSFKDCSMK